MNRTWVVGIGIVVVILGAVLYAQFSGPGQRDVDAQVGDAVAQQQGSDVGNPASRDPSVGVVGGVRRPSSDVAVRGDKEDDADDQENGSPDYGTTPPVRPDANPQVAMVVRAKLAGNRPELFSPAIQSNKFDSVAYQEDPQAYLDSPEPGRVFQPAQPGPGVPVLHRRSSYVQSVKQGEVVRLQVSAEPKAPVSFTSFDLGQFSNQLTTVTVAADDSGVATAEFLATSGTINRVNILSASPVTSGQVKFVVDISLPEE